MEIHGHRGFRGHYPENTIYGFLKAVDAGATHLEMDVVVTACNKILVSHEPYINHEICIDEFGNEISPEAEKQFNIYKMNYEQVLKFNCGIKGHSRFPNQTPLHSYKPLFIDVIKAVEHYTATKNLPPVNYNIEIKSVEGEEGLFQPEVNVFCDLIMKEISLLTIGNRFNLQSFDLRVLKYMNQKYNDVKLAVLIEENEAPCYKIEQCGFTPQICSPHFHIISTELIEHCHSLKMKIIPWTVNETEVMQRLIKIGVDGIITDYPDRLVECLKEFIKLKLN